MSTFNGTMEDVRELAEAGDEKAKKFADAVNGKDNEKK